MSAFNLKQLFLTLIEKYHPFNIRYFKVLVVIIMTLLLGTVLILGWLSSKKVREVVTDDFNQQQLVLARHAASQIKNSIDMLKREITLLSLSPAIKYPDLPSQNRLEVAFLSITEKGGALEIRFVEDETKKAYSMSNTHKCITENQTPEDIHYLEWARMQKDKGKIRLTEVSSVSYKNGDRELVMKMLLPVWQVSGDATFSAPPNKFSGVLLFVIDVNRLIDPITREIRSGKTGYPWVIDDSGMFLYHQDDEFIGKNAFEVRAGRTPTISFSRINEIQKEKMLKGEEGTSWYVSGWHRGVEKKLKKLIAYAPIELGENRIWSVAVVAPISEIEGAVHSILNQQFLLQGLIIFIILFGGLFINFMILSWSNLLEQEVAKKTIELRKSEQRYKSLVENAEDIIFTVNHQGNILSINKYGAKFFEKKEADIVGHNISEIFAWPSDEVLLFNIQKVFETKESRQLTQMVITAEHQFWFNTKLRRLWDEAGNVYAVLGISRDITALKEKEQEEQRYNIEKLASMGTLAAGVAHEINNPLAIILGFSDLLIEKSNPSTEEYDILKTIEKQAQNAKRVVENLLRFARYTEYKEELIDINKSIENILSIVKNTLFLDNISVSQHLQGKLPKVKADAAEMEQVFLNIINNAIHAMKNGGDLTITTSLNNGQIEIRFSDTGYGIKKEHRSKIFDPLFTTKKVGEGTGLGLSVSYGIIRMYGGSITFETKTPEESDYHGTTFIITLPAFEEKE